MKKLTESTEPCEFLPVIDLVVKAIDFKYTRYNSPCNCAIAKAAKREFATKSVIETVDGILINNKNYSHEFFWKSDFETDQEKAKELKFSNDTIRTITLIPDEPK